MNLYFNILTYLTLLPIYLSTRVIASESLESKNLFLNCSIEHPFYLKSKEV